MNDEKRTAVLYISHIVSPATIRNYFRIKEGMRSNFDVFWVYEGNHSSKILNLLPINVFRFSKDEINIPEKSEKQTGITPGNTPLITIKFSNNNEYDNYWFIEYDVQFTGNWNDVFSLTHECEADLIAEFIEFPFSDETWSHWESIDLPYAQVARCFGPIRRVSHRMLGRYEDLLASGYWAHHEILLPSMAKHEGWAVEELNDLAKKQRGGHIYTPANDQDEEGTLNYRPVTSTTWGKERNKLHHPVKPIRWFQDKFGMRAGVIEAYKAWGDS